MRREMATARDRKEAEHQDMTSSEGLELVPLMKSQATGRMVQTACRWKLLFKKGVNKKFKEFRTFFGFYRF